MTRRRLVFAAGLAAAAIAGCGGSGGGGGGGGGSGGSTSGPANAPPGQKVFADANCGSCHTLAAAHTSGTAGKKLDHAALDVATVERWVRSGGSGMPAFQDQLSATQIQQVAQFVANASR
jgi:cytochrome c551